MEFRFAFSNPKNIHRSISLWKGMISSPHLFPRPHLPPQTAPNRHIAAHPDCQTIIILVAMVQPLRRGATQLHNFRSQQCQL